MTPVLTGKGLVLGGLTFKNRGHWGSRYIMFIGTRIFSAFRSIRISKCTIKLDNPVHRTRFIKDRSRNLSQPKPKTLTNQNQKP